MASRVDKLFRRSSAWPLPASEGKPVRALSTGTNLAALNEGYLLSYDFIKLEQADVENIVGALR
jgi:hypothetical protein